MTQSGSRIIRIGFARVRIYWESCDTYGLQITGALWHSEERGNRSIELSDFGMALAYEALT